MRNRRKRYKQNKKKKLWEERLCTDIGKRWKARQTSYEANMEQEQQEQRDEEKRRQLMQEYKTVCLEKDKKCRQEIRSMQESVYQKVSQESYDVSKDDALLLPMVLVPDDAQSSELKKLDVHVTGIDRVAVSSALLKEKEKTKQAVEKAQFYRDLAERIRAEKREKVYELNNKVELVRNYWRNKLCEGSSRAGKLVQKALLNRNSM